MNRYIRHHIVFQNRNVNRFFRTMLIVTFPVFFLYFFLYTPARLAADAAPLPIGVLGGVATALGVAVGLAGLGLYLWTLVLFARAKGAQIPVVPTVSVVSTGPYAYTRNPMQTSAVFMMVGAGIAMNSWSFMLGGLVIPLAYLMYIRYVEEVELEARFGDEYLAYKAATPFLVPRFPGSRDTPGAGAPEAGP